DRRRRRGSRHSRRSAGQCGTPARELLDAGTASARLRRARSRVLAAHRNTVGVANVKRQLGIFRYALASTRSSPLLFASAPPRWRRGVTAKHNERLSIVGGKDYAVSHAPGY